MRRTVLMVFTGLLVAAGMTWAGTLDQNAADFPTTVNWCQYGCTAGIVATGSSWLSSGADTGEVGLNNTNLAGPYNLQQSVSFAGNFSPNMGLLYNGASFNQNGPGSDIVMTFDQAEFGAGAYIMGNYFGTFQATISLYDSSFNLLDTFTVTNGIANNNNDGSAMFLGAWETTADVWAVQFDASSTQWDCTNSSDCFEPDFAIGQAGLMESLPTTGTPEPASMLLMVPALLGLAAFGRKRISNMRGNN